MGRGNYPCVKAPSGSVLEIEGRQRKIKVMEQGGTGKGTETMIDRRVRRKSHGRTSACWRVMLAAAVWAGPGSGSAVAQLSGRERPFGLLLCGVRSLLRRGLHRRPAGLRIGGPQLDQDGPVAVDRLDLLRDDVRRVLLPDGSLDEALQHYTAALQLFVKFPDWMTEGAVPGDDPPGRDGGAGRRCLGA